MNRPHEASCPAVLISLLLIPTILLSGCCQPGYPCQTSGGGFGPSKAEVIGVAIGVVAVAGVGTALVVNHAHHTFKGCALTGPNGLELESNSEKKVYLLTGVTEGIKAGNLVKLHGSKKKQRGETTPEVSVEKLVKDYGPCTTQVAAAPDAAGSRKN